MAFQIKPLEGFEWECGYGAILAAAKFYDCDYKLAYKDLWKFDYNESANDDATLGSRIETSKIDTVDALYSYCNFRVTDHQMSEAKEVVSKIKEELEAGRPPKLRMDLYYCPWHKEAYRTLHLPHSFLITGAVQDDAFSFIDHSPMLDNGILYIKDLPPQHHYTVTTFDIVKKEAESFIWRKIISDRCRINLGIQGGKSIFDCEREFAGKLTGMKRLDKEYVDTDKFDRTDLYKNVIRNLQHRELYCEFLKFIAEKYETSELSDAIGKFNEITHRWDNIKTRFFKASKTADQEKTISRISERMTELSDFEENTAKELLEVTRINSTFPGRKETLATV